MSVSLSCRASAPMVQGLVSNSAPHVKPISIYCTSSIVAGYYSYALQIYFSAKWVLLRASNAFTSVCVGEYMAISRYVAVTSTIYFKVLLVGPTVVIPFLVWCYCVIPAKAKFYPITFIDPVPVKVYSWAVFGLEITMALYF